ncbi:RagB/SusD family nutrient uptake outer membrane protein [Chryseobacterium indologenes]|uniref:RagB/SusD family nutrient uptake outer membrane protein n=1 Tax=Chryseobacterium indologenes TaxID=253 RepID=UPI000F4D94A1|nr:RagB/SusD family nutrient uptake outer membrane protein [Chryseobacterium indologenes]AYZ34147.1 RagB/SusD family nutrient uptake outer membrane protein [Chryseobacterium indologenes]MBF6642665.1 RagB/SusD family nutrient uptake outer membrane protein [Chryseobacterium indologenes]MBU3047049.1 RagB/SusD family nutrient uptake outer membrane protein [Chryseobacterium indologenes]MEB4762710.1 RagB/SusD family nutrient uptake outer membrane protein [Chryseobacterium indologenes]QQQ69283.1 RagB
MKIFNRILIITGLSASLLSCTNELDIQPEGTPTEASFWKTENDLITGANAMYKPLSDSEFYGRGFFWFINASDDMVTGRSKSEADNVKNFSSNYIAAGDLETQWNKRYTVIGVANRVIRNVNNIQASQAVKNKYLGEALFMSSRMYFELAYSYGNEKAGIPIVDRTKEPDGPTPRAANVMENYKFIVEDLKKAAELLPSQAELPAKDYGRPHKAAAWALLAKVYLFMKDWQNAAFWANEVMTKGNRNLLNNYADVFKAENNYSSEYIWSVPSTPKFNSVGSILPGVMLENKGWGEYNGWGYFQPTKELYDEYEAGDLRRNTTVLKLGDKFTFNGTERTYASSNSLTGYQFNKYMDAFKYPLSSGHVSANGDYPCTDLAVPIMRYAEVILIKAEALLMSGGNADQEINMIRTRAGLAPKTGCTMLDLKHERRCELAGEWADRHRDLVRWGDAQATYAKPLHGINGQVVWAARNFNPSVHNVWAVPQAEIVNSYGIIKQNEGW